MKFKVGDRVRRCNPQNSNGGRCDLIVGIIYEIKNEEIFLMLEDGYKHSSCPCRTEDLELISEVKMSKYDELKAKIKGLENGWDKEADNILMELWQSNGNSGGVKFEGQTIQKIEAPIWNDGGCEIRILNDEPEIVASFPAHSQCSKMTAFKLALLWLLDHSNIKKDEKAEEIKKLEEELGKLKERIEELKR